jgi:hypothetical protein
VRFVAVESTSNLGRGYGLRRCCRFRHQRYIHVPFWEKHELFPIGELIDDIAQCQQAVAYVNVGRDGKASTNQAIAYLLLMKAPSLRRSSWLVARSLPARSIRLSCETLTAFGLALS